MQYSRWPDIAAYCQEEKMPLFRAIPLFLNSVIFAAIGYGDSGNFAAIEKWLCVVY